jgi:hypothetical protein
MIHKTLTLELFKGQVSNLLTVLRVGGNGRKPKYASGNLTEDTLPHVPFLLFKWMCRFQGNCLTPQELITILL